MLDWLTDSLQPSVGEAPLERSAALCKAAGSSPRRNVEFGCRGGESISGAYQVNVGNRRKNSTEKESLKDKRERAREREDNRSKGQVDRRQKRKQMGVERHICHDDERRREINSRFRRK
ncbi:hypothetical protein SRHO_G00195000 [Serrasalmus rhombeus]